MKSELKYNILDYVILIACMLDLYGVKPNTLLVQVMSKKKKKI